jgi:hypothetical protein
MPAAWVTYSWRDNENQDVDYVAQELEKCGITIKLDRWSLSPGKRLWEQIERFIQDPTQCDAWVLYATANSLGSEACKEEFAYALDRALQSRGTAFPIIALFPSKIGEDLIPAGIRTRLHVSIRDADWKERTKAGVEGRSPEIAHRIVGEFDAKLHFKNYPTGRQYIVEVRPRAGTWCPFLAKVPLAERESVRPSISVGAPGVAQEVAILFGPAEGSHSDDKGDWWYVLAQNEVSPTQSGYVHLRAIPSKLSVGSAAPGGRIHTFEDFRTNVRESGGGGL